MTACVLLLKLKIILNFRLKNTQNCWFCRVIILECALKQLDYSNSLSMGDTDSTWLSLVDHLLMENSGS